MKPRSKRAGSTVVFSVSVDRETKKLLLAEARARHGGNMSALIKEYAHEAAQRQAARELLKLFGHKPMSDERQRAFLAELEEELARQVIRPRKARRRAA